MINGVSGFHLDAYVMALEGWRRGLTLKWYYDPSLVTDLQVIGRDPLGSVFSLSSQQTTHYFQRSRGDLVNNQAVEIGGNKQLSKQYFIEAGVSVLDGKQFSNVTSSHEMVQYARTIGFPLVVKPTFGSLGRGVHVNITSIRELKRSIHEIQQLGFDDMIIERFFSGNDLRVYVLDEKVIAATKRIPAHVIGDGEQRIAELIEEKNHLRSKSPYFKTRLITIDPYVIEFLKQEQRTLQCIPPKGEKVFLTDIANISMGGDPIDVTDQLHPTLQKMAIKAVNAIPGLNHAGVDLLYNDHGAVVIEINPTAVIGSHLFPSIGKSRHVPEAIIDYYFPETKGLACENQDLFFAYPKIKQLIRQAVVQELQVKSAPAGELYA